MATITRTAVHLTLDIPRWSTSVGNAMANVGTSHTVYTGCMMFGLTYTLLPGFHINLFNRTNRLENDCHCDLDRDRALTSRGARSGKEVSHSPIPFAL